MEPKPIDKKLLKQEEDGARAPRRSPQRVPDFPFDFNWWVADPYVRALCRDERAGLLDMMCYSLKTPQPGIMTEEQVRLWAGYTPEEWTCHQTHFLPLFRVRPDGTWTMPVLRAVFLAQRRRVRRARKAAREANRKRWQDNVKHAVRTPIGYISDAKRGVKSIRSESLGSQDSRSVTTPVPRLRHGSPTPPPGGLAPAAAPGDQLLGEVVARLVRGDPGS